MGLTYLDSCIVIYIVERDPRWSAAVASGRLRFEGDVLAVSPLVKAECLVAPYRREDSLQEARYMQFFQQCTVLDLPEAVYFEAAHQRARHRLKLPDALHLACARYHGCEALWTNDDRLHDASGGMAVSLA
jgi:uncharacterized protein